MGYSHLAGWFRSKSIKWGLKDESKMGSNGGGVGAGDFVGVMGGDLLRSESILYRVYDRGRGFKLGMTICVELDGYAK